MLNYNSVKFDPSAYLDFLDTIEARNPDGTFNNLANPDWGASHHAFIRVTENSYPDGVGVAWDLPLQNNSSQGIPPNSPNMIGDLPRPRDITDQIMKQPTDSAGNDLDIRSSAGISEYFQFFGQFLTHDVAEAELVGAATSDGTPVAGDGPPLFLDGLPFPMNRTPDADGVPFNGNVRQQKNDETSYLDLSNVYGHSQQILKLLRERDGGGGYTAYMLTGAKDNLLPTLQEVFDHHRPYIANLTLNGGPVGATAPRNDVADILGGLPGGSPAEGFAAGDNRVNQTPHLASHHIVWMRNHNWHAEHLEEAYGDKWSAEEIFQAARALNEADWQNVVFNEYMSKLVGPNALSKYAGYNPTVDATIINEWTSVAFRFGHDETREKLDALAENGKVIDTLSLGEAFALGPDGSRNHDDLNKFVRAQLSAYTQEIDGKVVNGNRNALFGIPNGQGGFLTVDLEVFDIARGRDHGVGRYNELREGLGLDGYDSFDDFGTKNKVDAVTLGKLKQLYNTDGGATDGIDRLDSIVGGLLEAKAKGSLLGETFTILNVMQFENLRDGDRHFYLNRFADHPELIRMIEATSLADIVARNTTIEHVYRDAFAAHARVGGTDGNNMLKGGGNADLIIGFKGNDKLYGGSGDDDLHGGDGNDLARSGGGNDIALGGKGNDRLHGDGGHDLVKGGDGNDGLYGGLGDDFLFGEKGNDRLYGGSGKDHVNGGDGNDHLFGGSSPDVFAFAQKAWRDVIYDFGRTDKLDLSALGFDSLADVRAATKQSKSFQTINLDDHGAEIKLLGVKWSLSEANLILDDGAFA